MTEIETIASANGGGGVTALSQDDIKAAALAALNGLKSKSRVVESWRSGLSWYKKYGDGFVEQGGASTSTLSNDTLTLVSLHVPFSSTTYHVNVAPRRSDAAWNHGAYVTYANMSAGSFKFNACVSNGSAVRMSGYSWYACGY